MKYKKKYVNLMEEFSDLKCNIFLGDIHGDFSRIIDLILKGATNSVITICGDVGLGFAKPRYYENILSRVQRYLDKSDSVVTMVRGNHDDPRYFNDTESVSKNLSNGLSRIIIADDYDIYTLPNDYTLLCIGGGVSIDRNDRVLGEDLFSGEEVRFPTKEERDWILDTTNHPAVNIIVSHIAPTTSTIMGRKSLLYDIDDSIEDLAWNERVNMTNIIDDLSYYTDIKYHFHGHYHRHNECTTRTGCRIVGLGSNEYYELRNY